MLGWVPCAKSAPQAHCWFGATGRGHEARWRRKQSEVRWSSPEVLRLGQPWDGPAHLNRGGGTQAGGGAALPGSRASQK